MTADGDHAGEPTPQLSAPKTNGLVRTDLVAPGDGTFQGLLAAAPDAMVTVNPDGAITFVNDQMEKLFGYTRTELIGEAVEILLPTSARALHPGLRRRYLTQPSTRQMGGGRQLSAQRKDGTTFPVDIRLGSIEIGGVTIVTAAIRDVSERISLLTALQESDTLLHQLADNVDVAFILRNLDPPTFLYISPGYERIFGYNPMDAGEDPLTSLMTIHPDDIDRFTVDYWSPTRVGMPAHAEYRIIRPDGQVRWMSATNVPVTDADGIARRCAATVEDITDRKMVEAQLVAAHEDLEKANAAKGEFLSRMSHELRTPLNAILGFAQLLDLDDELSTEQRDSVHHILRGGRHLLSLIDDVLDFTTLESNRLDVSVAPTSVSDLLAETIELMIPAADTMHIALRYHPDATAGLSITADSRRLRQVLLNLLSNAIKYNHPGGGVDVYCERGQGPLLDILVRDTGWGIRPDLFPRLFTPFDRLGAETTGIDGTGVGLALAHRLMSSMGGSLVAHSEIGVGSTFIASIPVAALPATPTEPAVLANSTSPRSGPAASGNVVSVSVQSPINTLLYVEDNRSNVELMTRLVGRRSAWQMTVAESGATGLDIAAATAPNLVLLDLHLPDMDGIDVLRQLRANTKTESIPVVILSADTSSKQINQLLDAGAQAYLTKPLAVAEVFELLDGYESIRG